MTPQCGGSPRKPYEPTTNSSSGTSGTGNVLGAALGLFSGGSSGISGGSSGTKKFESKIPKEPFVQLKIGKSLRRTATHKVAVGTVDMGPKQANLISTITIHVLFT